MKADDRLNFEEIERASATIVESGVIVEWYADEVGDRVLGFIGKGGIVVSAGALFLRLRLRGGSFASQGRTSPSGTTQS
jgi:hypothetical protein